MCHETSFEIFQLFEKGKFILVLRAIQRQAVGQLKDHDEKQVLFLSNKNFLKHFMGMWKGGCNITSFLLLQICLGDYGEQA